MIDLDSVEAWLRDEVAGLNVRDAAVSILRLGQETDKPAIRLVLEWPGTVAGLVIWNTGEWDVERVGDDESCNLYRYSETLSKSAIRNTLEELLRGL